MHSMKDRRRDPLPGELASALGTSGAADTVPAVPRTFHKPDRRQVKWGIAAALALLLACAAAVWGLSGVRLGRAADRLLFCAVKDCERYGVGNGEKVLQMNLAWGTRGIGGNPDAPAFGQALEPAVPGELEPSFSLYAGGGELMRGLGPWAEDREIRIDFYRFEEEPPEPASMLHYRGAWYLVQYEGTFYAVADAEWLAALFDELLWMEPAFRFYLGVTVDGDPL